MLAARQRLNASSSVSCQVGLAAYPNTAAGLSVSFDDIEAVVRR